MRTMATSRLRLWGHRRDELDGEQRTLTRETLPQVMLPAASGVPASTPTGALADANVWACVRALADAAASVPLVCYRRTGQGRARFAGRTPDLLGRPAPGTTQAGLVGQLLAHLLLYGNGYIGKFRGPDGRVEQLALLGPDRVLPEVKAGVPRFTVLDGRGSRTEHGLEDIVHVRALTTDGLVGLSPIRQCRVALGLSSQLAEHASQFFANSAMPAGILKVNQFGATDTQVEALRTGWNTQHQGVANAHRIAVVTGEVDFTALSLPLEDQEFLGQRKLSAVEVARVFRVPPWIIGADAGQSMTYSNVEQESLHFVTYSLRPWLVAVEQALTADPDLFAGPQYCEFLLDALLRADSKTRAEVYALALDPDKGWMSRDEVRRLENLEAGG